MPTLMIDTVCGIPAFKVQVGPDETIRSLQIKCAKAAHVNTLTWKNMKLINNKEDVRVRLSRGRVFLKPTDTVAALGLQNGSRLMLHTRSRPLIPNYNGHPLVMTAPLPVYSFGREDYDLWVNVCAPNGQRLFKLKLTSEMNTTKVLSMAVKQAKLRGFGDLEQAAENGEVRLTHKGVEMKPGKSISAYHLQTGHEIDLHAGDDDDSATPEGPMDEDVSLSHDSAPTSREEDLGSGDGIVGVMVDAPSSRARVAADDTLELDEGDDGGEDDISLFDASPSSPERDDCSLSETLEDWKAIEVDTDSGNDAEAAELEGPSEVVAGEAAAPPSTPALRDALKAEGNGHVARGDWRSAIGCYRRALSMTFGEEEEEVDPVVLAALWSNLSLALLRAGG
ncbi:hypothetical protein Ctob_010538 [Chrysochromulina tobinii]|uniref:Ubiquitin-like domain-containing protein n=1 Tax=Chrysochromulina tobinii TaxID=1460289 RepID=A0A0M0K223_9EUKA|nr:hypothetical protein Ctob_010538 [Chrysochromulina tobinii]|eukprot:KOO32632.1 hypothetical protein Ctob_010538 [Chrysochromulina sp. CCMP291]